MSSSLHTLHRLPILLSDRILLPHLPSYLLLWSHLPLLPFVHSIPTPLASLLYFQGEAHSYLRSFERTSVLSTWNILPPVTPTVSASEPSGLNSNVLVPKRNFFNRSPYMKSHTLSLCQALFFM